MTSMSCQQKRTDGHRSTMRRALAADGGFFHCGYAYFWAYFFISPHAERRVEF